MARIAVDAMGGDHAPDAVVAGAVDAFHRGHDVVLVGDPARIEPLLERSDADLPVVSALEVIEMADDPSRAIREKKNASITVAAQLVASGEAAGMVSAGSTGASMAASAFVIGRLPGVGRPAIASFFPNRKILLDSGANTACRPEHLVQFAVMGAALAATHHGFDLPRIGLLNIGEEEGKGRDLEKEAFRLIKALGGIRFVGNVEGRDLARDTADVFITDGFTGNVMLKTAEGASQLVLRLLERSLADIAPVSVADDVISALRTALNPETVGGAQLLGTRGVVVIAHGSASRVAVANAIGLAAGGAEQGLVDKVADGLLRAAAAVG
jgi:glycerol-3-phosphate acyltransferase PlsX